MRHFTLIHVNRDRESDGAYKFMPLGCLWLTTALETAGFTVNFRDYQFTTGEYNDPSNLAAFVLEALREQDGVTSTPLVGFSTMADSLPVVILASELLKAHDPAPIIIIGGPAVHAIGAKVLEAFPQIDLAVVGEGEETLVEVLNHTKELQSIDARTLTKVVLDRHIPGVVCRNERAVVFTGRRPRLTDLDTIPYPEACSIDLSGYNAISTLSCRGCPYNCAFCDASVLWGSKTVCRSIPRLINELKVLFDRSNCTHLYLEDDYFTISRTRVLEFCRSLMNELPELTWSCLGRMDKVDAELLHTMHDSGCIKIFYGVESGSPAVLEKIRKNISIPLKEAWSVVEDTLPLMNVRAHFMWGFPFETLEEFYRTFFLIGYFEALGVEVVHSHVVPFVGTTLYDEYHQTLEFFEEYPFPRLFRLPKIHSLRERYRRLVLEHPDIFPSYFSYSTPEREEKFSFVKKYHTGSLNR